MLKLINKFLRENLCKEEICGVLASPPRSPQFGEGEAEHSEAGGEVE